MRHAAPRDPTFRSSRGRLPDWRTPAGPWPTRALIAVAVVAVALVRAAVGEPALGVSFLSVVPIAAAAVLLGRVDALLIAAGAFTLALVNEVVADPSPALGGGLRVAAAASRGVVFFAVAILIAELGVRRDRATLALAATERELAELAALREVLTPPRLPVRRDLELGAAFTPAAGLVGGDFFLVAPARGDSTALVVGDVLGHGLQAAQRGAFVRAALGTFLVYEDDPARLLRLVNQALLDRDDAVPEFVTAVCAVIRPDWSLGWASAGHWPPWDLDRAEPLTAPVRCAPLGVADDLSCATADAVLRPGAGLLLYTDGLIEASSPAGSRPRARLGEAAARDELRRQAGRPPPALVEALQPATPHLARRAPPDHLCLP